MPPALLAGQINYRLPPAAGVAALLLYLGFLSLGLVNLVSTALIGAGIAVALLLLCYRHRLSWFALAIAGLAFYKTAYYFLLNWPIPLDTAWLNQEGRFLVSLAILSAFSCLAVSIHDLNFFIRSAGWIYLAWLPLLFLNAATGHGLIGGSHHQLGLVTVSGLFLFLVRNSYYRSAKYWIILAVGFLAILLSNSRTSLLMALLMVAGPVWFAMRLRKKVLTLSALGILTILFAGEQIRIGERIYDLGAYNYLAAAIDYGYENSNRIAEAAEAQEANVQGADFNVIGRGVMYGKASGLFASSPLFGVGEGRFDDVAASCANLDELGCIHYFGPSNFGGTTAHNTLLHLLAEEGIIGLAATLLVAVWLYRRVAARATLLERHGLNSAVVRMLFWMLLFAALFNHVLASPLYLLALLLPLLLVSSLAMRAGSKTGAAS
jgi:hypothetical protein